MRKITSEDETRIVMALLQGDSYRQITSDNNVSLATVNRVVEDQRMKIPDFNQLRDTALALRKNGISVFDAKRVNVLVEALNKLGVNFQELENYVQLVLRILAEKKAAPDILEYAIELMKLEIESGKTPQEIIEYLENALSEAQTLKKQASTSLKQYEETETAKKKAETKLQRLNNEIQETIDTLRGANSLNKATLSKLVKFIEHFESIGFNVDEVSNLAKWRQQLQKLGIDPDKLGGWITEHGSLESQNLSLKLENQEQESIKNSQTATNRRLIGTNNKLRTLQQILTEKSIPLQCKTCGATLTARLRTKKELAEMMNSNTNILVLCNACNHLQAMAAWDFLVGLGWMTAPEDDEDSITIHLDM